MFERDLEKDVKKESKGDFEAILVSALQAGRDDDEEDVDEDQAEKDAAALYDAGEDSWGTDEATFNKILMTRSRKQLRAVFDAYIEKSGNDIEKAIKKEMKGDLETAALTVVRHIKDPIWYY